MDWDALYAHLVTCTGWTWDYCRNHVDIPRLRALQAHWKHLPPPAISLRRIGQVLGIKPEVSPAKVSSPQEVRQQLGGLMPTMTVPDDVKARIGSPADALKEMERLFFGEVRELK